jgi:hypothetical protein
MTSADPVSGRRLLISVAAGFLAAALLIAATVLALRLGARGWSVDHLPDLVAISLLDVYAGLLVGIVAVFGWRRIRTQLGLRFTGVGHILLALGAWVVGIVTGTVVTAALAPLMGRPANNAKEILSVGSDPLFLALIAFTVCLLGPLVEELLFRGMLLGWLSRRLPIAIAIVISALVFAGLHFIPTLLPFLFILGITTGLVRWYTGSTLNSLVVHVCQNTLAVAATLLVLRGAG